MIRILIMMPDGIKKPMGGMGVQCEKIIEQFPENYYFDIIGSWSQESFSGKNYTYYPVGQVTTGVTQQDPFCESFLEQSLFLDVALSLKEKPDIIHCFDWCTTWAGRLLKKRWDIPLITTIQLSIDKMMNDDFGYVHPLQKKSFDTAVSLEHMALASSDKIIQVSEYYAKLFYIYKNKTTVINNGINVEEFENYNKIELPGENKIKVVFLGRITQMKGILEILHTKVPENIDLIIIGSSKGGEPEMAKALELYTKRANNVYMVGNKYDQDKIDYLCNADAVLMPSTHEPFGIVALEALASKSILISSFVGGMGDFLSEEFALNCGNSPKGIENSLKKLIEMNEEEKEKRINLGYEVAKEYNWKKPAKKLKTIYEELLNG